VGLDADLGDDVQAVVAGDHPERLDPGAPVVPVGLHRRGRVDPQAEVEDPLAVVVDRARPQLVVGLAHRRVVAEPGLVADVEPHSRTAGGTAESSPSAASPPRSSWR
jgi:hypothetical protein